MSTDARKSAQWRKSSYSGSGAQCVEVADSATTTAVRDSKNPDGPVVTFPRTTWVRFARGFRG
ncbi:DUF397 domain-containing protein [Umezawaea tangerina]|uniref:Uncharacterized protein DUF397 n=1 Tax=Umezawaea tangerina TaxID=84725 RepID=A0A2T0T4A5_9PSEU|nr:DUF397 domain-containing protein [Umezawaea tangerina]PRY40515.1 uncharacterized protein DUF397 [Umezawaea tangerina]